MHSTFISFCFLAVFIRITCSLNFSTTARPLKARESLDLSTTPITTAAKTQKLYTADANGELAAKGTAEYEDGDYDNSDDDEEDEEGDTEIDNEEVPKKSTGSRRNKKIPKRVGITYYWGRWEKWSRCTNTCVQIRRRFCIKRIQNSTNSEPEEISFYPEAETSGCVGFMKKFRLCKDEKCTKPNNRQMRNEQCAPFNRIIFRGRFYQWQGYAKEHNECELHCRAKDSDMVMGMNKSVTDGTPCQKPSIYYTHYYRRKAVCVEGICRAVHSSGAIRPATTKDSHERCGSVLCQKVNEIFTQTKLNAGYNFITTIPMGAMNLTIHEMGKSDNLIALKTKDDQYIVNGFNRPSEGGLYEYNDDTFDYNKEARMVKAKGPLNNPVVLMLLVHGLNPGVIYTYSLPVPSASITEPEELQSQWNELGQPLDEIDDNYIRGSQVSRTKEKKKRKYAWELLGFGPCSRSCGLGKQSPIFRCIRETDGKESFRRYYSPKRCANIEKPTFLDPIYTCSHGLCPGYWKTGDYGECQCPLGAVDGVKWREVSCFQEDINGTHAAVNETICRETKPLLKERCNCKKVKLYARNAEKTSQMYARLIGSPTTIKNLMTKRHSENTSISTSLKRHYRDDKTGVWVMSDWNQQCSKDCAYNYEHRTIYCDRTAPYIDPCDPLAIPEDKRACTNRSHSCRRGMWFASDWSKCAGDCSNRRRTRMVLCVMDGFVVDSKQCDIKQKPIEVANCAVKDMTFCGPKWHYSEWSECSRSCGEGVQRRYAKCLEYDWKLKEMTESNKCKYLEREPVYGACTVSHCEELRVHNAAANAANAVSAYGRAGEVAGDQYEYDADGDDVGYDGEGDDSFHDLSGGNEKLVIASAPKVLHNCREELNNCKRINRERLCKLDYYKTYCCLTCHGYN